MSNKQHGSIRTPITLAVITLIGVLGIVLISHRDKVFPIGSGEKTNLEALDLNLGGVQIHSIQLVPTPPDTLSTQQEVKVRMAYKFNREDYRFAFMSVYPRIVGNNCEAELSNELKESQIHNSGIVEGTFSLSGSGCKNCFIDALMIEIKQIGAFSNDPQGKPIVEPVEIIYILN